MMTVMKVTLKEMLILKIRNSSQCHGSEFNLDFISVTDTSQEELPITNWNELSIIERVGLNRCNYKHNVIMISI